MSIHRDLPHIDHAASAESWEYLYEQAPLWADAVAEEVRAGASPEEIFKGVLRRVGAHREALALRCKLAAQYLISDEQARTRIFK